MTEQERTKLIAAMEDFGGSITRCITELKKPLETTIQPDPHAAPRARWESAAEVPGRPDLREENGRWIMCEILHDEDGPNVWWPCHIPQWAKNREYRIIRAETWLEAFLRHEREGKKAEIQCLTKLGTWGHCAVSDADSLERGGREIRIVTQQPQTDADKWRGMLTTDRVGVRRDADGVEWTYALEFSDELARAKNAHYEPGVLLKDESFRLVPMDAEKPEPTQAEKNAAIVAEFRALPDDGRHVLEFEATPGIWKESYAKNKPQVLPPVPYRIRTLTPREHWESMQPTEWPAVRQDAKGRQWTWSVPEWSDELTIKTFKTASAPYWNDGVTYRLIQLPESPEPEPRFVPWTFEDGPMNLKVRNKFNGEVARAALFPDAYSVVYSRTLKSLSLVSFADLLSDFEQLDGQPCGKPAKEVAK